jgi:glycosyltransferase involved in cell wall biosynthesis
MTNDQRPMTIAINATYLLESTKEGYGNFIYECFLRISKQHHQHTFIFIFDKPFYPSFIFSSNIVPVIVGPQPKSLLLLKFWFNYKIPVVLKNHKADIFITSEICSLRTRVPQLLIINDLTFSNHYKFNSKRYLTYYKKNTPKFLNKARIITALSNYCKNDILKSCQIEANKIEVVYTGAGGKFEIIDFNEREKIKEQYSKGKEYFLFYGDIYKEKGLFNILKAFSIFKKWQKSSMKLLIVTNLVLRPEEDKRLQLFKYKDDVKILNETLDELPKITASAYAVIDLSYHESFGVHSLGAMKCNVPVITGDEGAMTEVGAEAALYARPDDHKIIAEKMMMIFKDEKLRNELIKKGEEQATKYNWEKTAELFWQSILKASH